MSWPCCPSPSRAAGGTEAAQGGQSECSGSAKGRHPQPGAGTPKQGEAMSDNIYPWHPELRGASGSLTNTRKRKWKIIVHRHVSLSATPTALGRAGQSENSLAWAGSVFPQSSRLSGHRLPPQCHGSCDPARGARPVPGEPRS